MDGWVDQWSPCGFGRSTNGCYWWSTRKGWNFGYLWIEGLITYNGRVAGDLISIGNQAISLVKRYNLRSTVLCGMGEFSKKETIVPNQFILHCEEINRVKYCVYVCCYHEYSFCMVFDMNCFWLMLGYFYFQTRTMPGLKRAGGPEPCPAAGCAFFGPYRTLLIHWRSFHDPQVLLYLCPLPGCKFQTPKPHGLRQHWEGRHSASPQQSLQLRTLPLLANFVHNRHRRDPGLCVAPVPPAQRPLGSLPHSIKGDLLVQVKGILGEHKQERAPTPASTSLVVPPCPGLQPGSVKEEEDQQMVVETPREASTRDKCTTVTTPGVMPPTPAIIGFSLGQLNLTKLVSSPALPDSPILVQSSPSYELSLSTSPVSPAFTTLSTPTLAILMSSPALPPVSSLSSDRDPVLAQGSTRPLEPPPLTRILLDEYVPSTPSAILPASVDVPPVSSSVTTAHPEVPATDRDTLVSRLQDVDGRRARLDLKRIGILQELATRESEELLNTRQQLQEMQQRCQLLESQLMRLRSSSFPTAEVVGDLAYHGYAMRKILPLCIKQSPVNQRVSYVCLVTTVAYIAFG